MQPSSIDEHAHKVLAKDPLLASVISVVVQMSHGDVFDFAVFAASASSQYDAFRLSLFNKVTDVLSRCVHYISFRFQRALLPHVMFR